MQQATLPPELLARMCEADFLDQACAKADPDTGSQTLASDAKAALDTFLAEQQED